jgi:alcohol dehydrogenase
MEFNMGQAVGAYSELATILGIYAGQEKDRAQGLIDWFKNIAVEAGIETRLRDVGVKEDDLDMLADDAMLQTRLLVNNPRDVSRSDAYAIYKAAY